MEVFEELAPDMRDKPEAERREKSPDQDLRVGHSSSFLAVSAGVVGMVSYACSLLMANMLETPDYTMFAAAAMLIGIVGVVAAALVPLPLSHVVAVHPEGSKGRRDGIAFSVFVSCIAGIAAAALTGGLTLLLATPTLAVAVALGSFAIFIVTAPAGWLQGELRFTWYALRTIGEVTLRLFFSLLVLAMAWGAGGAVTGFVVGALGGLLVPRAFYRDVRWRPQVLREKWRWAETSDIASVLCVVSVLVGIDVVMVGFLDGGSAAAAGFQALSTIAKGPVYVAAGTALVAFPLLRTPGVNVGAVLRDAFAAFGQLAVMAFAIIATAPHLLVGLAIPQKYHDSLDFLPWLAASGLSYAVLMGLSTILLALRAYRRCQVGLACACLLVGGGLWVGWRMNAVTGMAVGCAIGAMLAALVLVVLARPILLTANPGRVAGRYALYAVALVVVLAVASILNPIVWLLLAAVAGIAVLAHQRESLPSRKDLSKFRRHLTGAARKGTGRRSKAGPHSTSPLVAWGAWTLSRNLTAFIAVVAAAFGVRALGLERGFELWVDEMLYVRLGESISTGQFPTLPDGPFFLHPPGYFLLEAGAIKLFGISGEIIEMTLQLRWLNAVLGAITVGLGFLLVRKLATSTAAWFTAVLLAFEPFILRNNSHDFLETSAMLPALAGLLILLGTRDPQGKARSFLKLATVGLLLGYSVLCKDFFLVCTVAPVIAAVAWRRTLTWRKALVIIGFGSLPYSIYLLLVTTDGNLPAWVWAKSNGLLRMSGVEKTTGFTAEGSPSLISRLIEQSGHFGTSYLLLGLCPVAGLLVCFSQHAKRRLIGLTGLSLGTAGAYSAIFGTFEEQYGYGVMVAGALCSVLAVVELHERYPKARKTLIVISTSYIALTIALGLRTELTTDNGFARANDWVKANLPANARISVTNSTTYFAYMDDPRFGIWPSAPLMKQNKVSYIMTQSTPTSQGYGYANPTMLTWLKTHATPLITTAGPTNGDTTIWFVDPLKLDTAAAANVGEPSKAYGTEK
ncbi:glycosyltransferase family 39 protein [Arthrobacter sp. Y-9]|uniref:glycosyltransferase family 39 protein n=1 Tax=Arthrobacter sp. Y-9 TaxID=3039385 RepID=UPI00241DDF32|nr:glycosyltransferase family 39 protein [Arthrobacter sp. Y-9]WFR84306.1 glycosyltransferase family 39 protein [Arthrobacter sp. Y-9]